MQLAHSNLESSAGTGRSGGGRPNSGSEVSHDDHAGGLGEPGWDGFVEQMDLVGEALVRTSYLRYGPSDGLKKEIRSGVHNKPDYGDLVRAIAQLDGVASSVSYRPSMLQCQGSLLSGTRPKVDALVASQR